TESMLSGILKIAKQKEAVIFHTLVNADLSKLIEDFAMANNLQNVDCVQKPMKAISNQLGFNPERVSGLVHDLNDDYFKRIEAMEFSVENDVVILGISRTSKTPLSLYLANKQVKVSNVPIGPTIQLPKEIFDVDPKKIIGLTSVTKDIQKIRKARMASYGIDEDTPYSNSKNIDEELEYANNLYHKLGCLIIDVHD
ncbi:MAG: kinase/pyrophosphorylase, partial [Apilactobacillus kunkeei]|nr:kinase/pyrophosphorylase [Apilactobacillus kunkeei]